MLDFYSLVDWVGVCVVCADWNLGNENKCTNGHKGGNVQSVHGYLDICICIHSNTYILPNTVHITTAIVVVIIITIIIITHSEVEWSDLKPEFYL